MLLPVLGTSPHVLPFKIFINLWYCLIWYTVWWLGVKLPKPIYKKNSRATKTSPSGVWCIFLNPEHKQCHYFIPQTFYPYKMLHAEKVFSIMFDVSCLNAPSNICDLFTKANSEHKHETRFSSSGNYYVQTSGLNQNQGSSSSSGLNFGTQFPTNFVKICSHDLRH